MVLLEFRQPRGAAWFDDLSLSSGDGTERNLLAAPGFVEGDSAALQAQAISADYEKQVRAMLESVAAAAQSAASVTGNGLASYFPHELRDLDGAKEKLELCTRLLAARQ